MSRKIMAFVFVLVLAVACSPAWAVVNVLFDASHAQTVGNADWVIDEDSCGTAQRYPTPSQSNVTSSTPETYWSGAFSSFGIALVKHGYHVESLPAGASLTYGDSSNPQDLSHYDVLVLPEPNVQFTSAEKQAILDFVSNGGGLFMISDHAGADRNNNGWDAAEVFNDLGSDASFGIHFNVNTEADSWFDDHPDDTYTSDPNSPIVHGAYGDCSPGKGLGLYGATSMTLHPANNSTVAGQIWKSDGTPGSTTKVTFATAEYGQGRVAAIGDSSPAEDATNDCGHTTHDGWSASAYDNALIHLNAIAWLAGTASGGSGTPTEQISDGTFEGGLYGSSNTGSSGT
ncbi:MAG: hydrolase, partial [Acidobacteria bacterium]|nr:hydrolase [Acidobacteriota bacterium]